MTRTESRDEGQIPEVAGRRIGRAGLTVFVLAISCLSVASCGKTIDLDDVRWQTARLGHTIKLATNQDGCVLVVRLIEVADPAPEGVALYLDQPLGEDARPVAFRIELRNVGTRSHEFNPESDYVALESASGNALASFVGIGPDATIRKPERIEPGERVEGLVVLPAYGSADRLQFKLAIAGREGFVGARWNVP
jgi:hypothetical protein